MTTSLPPSAAPAWSAYLAMAETKQHHLDYLKQLEEKYQRYGQPSAQETARLKALLQAHDAQVSAFKKALQALKATDPAASAALIAAMTEHSALLGSDPAGRA